ncbi:hypothetical protein [Collinsella sp. SGI.033]
MIVSITIENVKGIVLQDVKLNALPNTVGSLGFPKCEMATN